MTTKRIQYIHDFVGITTFFPILYYNTQQLIILTYIHTENYKYMECSQ